MNCPIFVISLVRAQERRGAIAARLDAAGVAFEIVDAVDGAEVEALLSAAGPPPPPRDNFPSVAQQAHSAESTIATVALRLNREKFIAHQRHPIAPGELGCFLSHTDLWQRMVDEQIPRALILEDDAYLADDFFDVVVAVLQSKYHWNVVHLGAHKKRRVINTLQSLGNNRRLVRFAKPMACTHAYLIDLDGATKALRHCFEIHEPIDLRWKRYWEYGAHFYHVEPGVSHQQSETQYIGGRPRKTNKIVNWFRQGLLCSFLRGLLIVCERRHWHRHNPPRLRGNALPR